MKNIFKEKPTSAEVKAYEDKLNYYLQAHKASIKITLHESPIILYSVHGDGSKIYDYYWIDSIIFSSPIGNVEISTLFSEYSFSRDQYFDGKLAWTDAMEIQQEVYDKLGKFKEGFKWGNGDPYWKLWDYVPKK